MGIKQSSLFLGIMVILAGIAGVTTFSYLQSTGRYQVDTIATGAKVAGVAISRQTATMIINDGQQMKTYGQTVTDNKKITGLDLLRLAVAASEWSLKTSTSSMGTLVEEINGVKNGADGKYWIYYVNNQMGSVGIDQYQVQAGDILQMNFETSAF